MRCCLKVISAAQAEEISEDIGQFCLLFCKTVAEVTGDILEQDAEIRELLMNAFENIKSVVQVVQNENRSLFFLNIVTNSTKAKT